MSETTSDTDSSTATGLTTRLRTLLPITLTESGWAYDGPFSTYKEAHSFVLGFAAGYTDDPTLQTAVVAYATGRGLTKSRDDGTRADAHWRQVAEEPAYALAGLTIGRSIRDSRGTIPIDVPRLLDVVGTVLPVLF